MTTAPALAGLLVLLASCQAEREQPDIVLVVVDTLRADHVGVHGARRRTTPHVDALAREGAWFSRAHAHSGWTLPAVGSLLTGRLPSEHGMGRDGDDLAAFGRLRRGVPTLAELLSDAGYACGAIVNNTFLAPAFGAGRGFADYDYVGAAQNEIRRADASVDAALRWIDERRRPYFLLLHLMDPHLWYDPAREVRGTFAPCADPPVPVPFGDDALVTALREGRAELSAEQRDYVLRLYDEEILAVDRALGRLFDALRRSPRWPHTVVVVTADHGEEFGDHGGWEHGHTLFGELTQVPLVLRAPGGPHGEVADLVQHADVFRTILARAGVAPPAGTRGIDLCGRGTDGVAAVVAENVLYGPPRAAVVTERHAAHFALPSPEPEVFELDRAGHEQRRLGGTEGREVGARLLGELLRQRGDLAPHAAESAVEILSPSVLEQLRALGYVRGTPGGHPR